MNRGAPERLGCYRRAMTLARTLNRSAEIARKLGTLVMDLEAPNRTPHRTAGAVLSVALDMHTGIVTLVQHRLHAPALALLRPLIDAYVRGAWLSYCASDAEIARYLDGHNPAGGIDGMVAALEKEEAFSDGHLGKVKSRVWGTVCDFTHVGAGQVRRYLKANTIEPNISDEELIELLQAADSWAALATIAISDLAAREDIAAEVLRMVKDVG